MRSRGGGRGGEGEGGAGEKDGLGGERGRDVRFFRLVEQYGHFLNQEGEQGVRSQVREVVRSGGQRVIVSLSDVREGLGEDVARGLLHEPQQHLEAFQTALREHIEQLQQSEPDLFPHGKTSAADAVRDPYYVGVRGSFGAHHVTPRGLGSPLIAQYVCVEGIATQCSVVRPKVQRSVSFARSSGKYTVRRHLDPMVTDDTSTPQAMLPTQDDEGQRLVAEYGLSTYKDFQRIVLQEMPERAPAGQLPRSVEVVLEHDLVDRVKAGDRVRVYGIFRSISPTVATLFQTFLLASHVESAGREAQTGAMTDQDVENVREQSRRRDIFQVLARSVAPSIYGHEHIKRAMLLQLLGGLEHNLENGTHLRGDINILLVGDPSTAKSQLLRFALNAAPLAISTSGRGSSGVGLTAAVVNDKDSGERRLEAGAMVLADRGLVCLDEFDKMSEDDRVAIHEVMEQQTVTIAKAGIHTSLNARCAVLAAANPVYGQYDRHRPPGANIRLPDSLLSRFDLLFIVLDQLDASHDRAIASHVLTMHRYRGPGEADRAAQHALYGGAVSSSGVNALGLMNPGWLGTTPLEEALLESRAEDETGTSRVFERSSGGEEDPSLEVYTLSFLRKYVQYAKRFYKPRLTEEAADVISAEWAKLRSEQTGFRTLPITARTLETLIRLSVAHAKGRLQKEVSVEDASVAVDILRFALFHQASEDAPKRPRTAPPAEHSPGPSSSAAAAPSRELDAEVQAAITELRSANRRARSFSCAEVASCLIRRGRAHISESELFVIFNRLQSQDLLMLIDDQIHLLQ